MDFYPPDLDGPRTSAPTNGANGPSADSWPQPLAFPAVDLPSFPVEALPPSLREFVEAEAIATQTPVDLAAMLCLSVCAAALAKKVVVRAREGYEEPVNLYTVTAMPPGARKSPVFRDVLEPVRELEAELAEKMRPRILEAAQQLRIRQKALQQLEDKVAKATAKGEREKLMLEAADLAAQIEATKIPVSPRFIADDVTPEKLIGLLAEHDERMGVMSPEGGPFDMMAGRYSKDPNFEVYLKGYSGDEIRVDRKNGTSDHVRRPALTVGLAVQPDVLRGLASTPAFRGRGLLGRFFYSLPKDDVGYRMIAPPPVPAATAAAYAQRIKALFTFEPGRDAQGELQPMVLKLSPEASAAFIAFEAWIEPQLAEFGTLGGLRDWASKLAGGVLRIVGILGLNSHFQDPSIYMDASVVRDAISIARYLIEHAKAAFGLMGATERLEDAKYVLRCITRRSWNEFSKRDLYQAIKGDQRFKEVEALDEPLLALEQRNYIERLPDEKPSRPGRPASQRYRVNPYAHNPHNTQNRREAA